MLVAVYAAAGFWIVPRLQVDPARAFLAHADSQPPGEGKIKLELSLK